MTKARQVLQLLVEGDHSAELIAQKTGLPISDVREAIRTLRRDGRVESVSVPTHYKATPQGEKDLRRVPTPVKLLERKRHERHMREEQARAMVGDAIHNQPALVKVWGEMHA
jgi:hypothetical protein